jgi:RNA polymerase sigma-70 factor, ECF subfamily
VAGQSLPISTTVKVNCRVDGDISHLPRAGTWRTVAPFAHVLACSYFHRCPAAGFLGETDGLEAFVCMSGPTTVSPDTAPEGSGVEARLLQQIAQGDERALADLYDRLSGTLYSLALQILRDRTEAEDVVHDSFLHLWDKAATFDASRGSITAWAITVTRNRAIDRLRRRRRRSEILARADPADFGYDESARGEVDVVVALEDAQVVRQAFAALPEDQRAALQLAYFGGLSQVEIAARISAPLGTVKARIRRGLLRLKELLPRGP